MDNDNNEARISGTLKRGRGRMSSKTWDQRGVSDPIVPDGQASPGRMRMEAKTVLHTRLAINLFRGRQGDPSKNVRPIVGLARFAKEVASIWAASAADDPYADHVLLEIEAAYEDADKTLDRKLESVKDVVSSMEGIEIQFEESEKPVEFPLTFFSPWGYKGAALLKKLDELIRACLTARHIGLFTQEDWRATAHESMSRVRRMYHQSTLWTPTGVTRKDIAEETELAKQAFETYMVRRKGMLALHEDVMRGTVRAKLAPANEALRAGRHESAEIISAKLTART